jgi:hypothetical protein
MLDMLTAWPSASVKACLVVRDDRRNRQAVAASFLGIYPC